MLESLEKIVTLVGKRLLDWQLAGKKEGKWQGSQFKARADAMAHRELKKRLEKLLPGTPVISEEDPASLVSRRPERYWLIDPLDGTASFAGGFSGYVTQAAFMKNNRPELAAIFAPALGLLYTAERGKGAYLNGKKLGLSKSAPVTALIDNYPAPRGIAEKIFRAFKFKRYIESGSIALKICRVADGSAGLFVKDVPVRDWDLAAPYLVLKEARGTMTDIEGGKIGFNGDYAHKGLVAAPSPALGRKVVSWYLKSEKAGER